MTVGIAGALFVEIWLCGWSTYPKRRPKNITIANGQRPTWHALSACDTPRRCPCSIHLVEFKNSVYSYPSHCLHFWASSWNSRATTKWIWRYQCVEQKASHLSGPGPDLALELTCTATNALALPVKSGSIKLNHHLICPAHVVVITHLSANEFSTIWGDPTLTRLVRDAPAQA